MFYCTLQLVLPRQIHSNGQHPVARINYDQLHQITGPYVQASPLCSLAIILLQKELHSMFYPSAIESESIQPFSVLHSGIKREW